MKIKWPDGKRFAFTVFDDTDNTTMQNGPRIYQLLYELGIITTKSVWPVQGERAPKIGGTTCNDVDYLKWIRKLQERRFEIALHNATYHSSKREQVIAGLEQFKTFFGSYPNIQVNHADCEDNLYWGDSRLSGINKVVYNVMTRFRNRGKFQGDMESSEFFWGDRCQQQIKYARNFVYSDINTLKACPCMPYHDEKRPFVNYWFASSEGPNCQAFCKTVSEKNQDRLEEEGGACIMYTHFGSPDFYQDGQINPCFKQLMQRLSGKAGWFVPVSMLLDYIQKERARHNISDRERFRLEWKWLMEKIIIVGGTS